MTSFPVFRQTFGYSTLRVRHRGPRTLSKTTDANLDCTFVENELLFVALKIGRARAPLILPPLSAPCTQPGICAF